MFYLKLICDIIRKKGAVWKMSSELTPKQAAVLEIIKKNISQKGYPPSVREIGQAIGFSSSSTVHSYLKKLEEKGYLRRDPTKPRAIEVIDHQPTVKSEIINIPILGKVSAGSPLLAVENWDDCFPLPIHFTGAGEFFMLTVKGDSMIEAGILEGDLVIVRRQEDANNGDIIVALLGEEATVKRLFKENGYIRLQPENSKLEPIITRNVKILGKVIGLLRKIH